VADVITISGIAGYGYHGHHQEERRLGQRFLVDLEIGLDLRAAGRADDLSQTVDYSACVRAAREVLEGEPLNLIEAVAERIADTLLSGFDLIETVLVRVHKPGAPVAGPPIADIAVTIRRSRSVEVLENQ
jgi:dihydroneopterin aldolase